MIMNENGSSSPRFHFGLRHLFGWMTGVAVACGAAVAWMNYLQYVEAQTGYVSLCTAHATIVLAMLLLIAMISLLVIPLCVTFAWWRQRQRRKTLHR